MLLGPMATQVFDHHSKWLRPWQMFRDTGLQLLAVEFRVRQDGQERVIDRYQVLGYERATAPKWVRRVVKIRKLSRALCEALGPGTDLRIYAEWATLDGWQPRFAGEQNLCRHSRRKGR